MNGDNWWIYNILSHVSNKVRFQVLQGFDIYSNRVENFGIRCIQGHSFHIKDVRFFSRRPIDSQEAPSSFSLPRDVPDAREVHPRDRD